MPHVSARCSHLLVDPLAAVAALDVVLDDGVVREPLVSGSQAVQRETDAHEVEQPVEEEAV